MARFKLFLIGLVTDCEIWANLGNYDLFEIILLGLGTHSLFETF